MVEVYDLQLVAGSAEELARLTSAGERVRTLTWRDAVCFARAEARVEHLFEVPSPS